jgi:hypothetical protein
VRREIHSTLARCIANIKTMRLKIAVQVLFLWIITSLAPVGAAGSQAQGSLALKLTLVRAGQDRDVEVVLAHQMQRSYRIIPVAHPDPLEAAILKGWGGSK